MQLMTDRKRAIGLGSGRHGTHHHWQMMVTSMALVVLVPVFLITFGLGLGGTYEEVLAYFSRPFPAIMTMLTIGVGIFHLMNEVIVAVEDYVPGTKGKLTIFAVTAVSYIMILAGVFAVLRIAL
jgi:succinate dehydrogenase / fumarate reductase membrane anchor subunit